MRRETTGSIYELSTSTQPGGGAARDSSLRKLFLPVPETRTCDSFEACGEEESSHLDRDSMERETAQRVETPAIAGMKRSRPKTQAAMGGRSFGYASKGPADKVKWFHGGDDHASQQQRRRREGHPRFQNSLNRWLIRGP